MTIEDDNYEAPPEVSDPSEAADYLEAFQNESGVALVEPEAEVEEDAAQEDMEELELEGQRIPVHRDHLRKLAQVGAQASRINQELNERAKKLDELAATLEDVNSLAGGVASFVANDHKGIASKMIENIIAGRPLTTELEEFDLSDFLGGRKLPQPARRSSRREVIEEDEDDDTYEDDEEEAPRARHGKASKSELAHAKALQNMALTLQAIQKRQEELDQREEARRQREEQGTLEARRKALRDQIETAILRTPSLAELPRKDAMEMMVAKMQSSGSSDPYLIAQYWGKTLGKRDAKVATAAVREQKQVAKSYAPLPRSGAVPTGRVNAKVRSERKPKTVEELQDMLTEQLEALGEGQ